MPKRFFHLVFRNLFLSRVRTLITILGCIVGALIISFFLCVENSLEKVLNDVGDDSNLIITQKDHFCPTSGKLSDSEMKSIRKQIPQVAEVMPVRLLTTACGSTSDAIAVHGINKDKYSEFSAYRQIVPSGDSDFMDRKNGALVERSIAGKRGWKIGDQVTLEEIGGLNFVVSGIFDSNSSSQDNTILVDRDFLQDAANERGISNHVLVKLVPTADSAETCRQIDSLPFSVKTHTQPEQIFLTTALNQLVDLIGISKAIIGVIIVVMLTAIGNAISMATKDRTAEFGILRTLGFRKVAILLMVLSEGLMQTFVGGVAGCLVLWSLIQFGIVSNIPTWGTTVTVTISMGVRTWLISIIVIVATGTLGSLIPAWLASQVDVCAAIRREG